MPYYHRRLPGGEPAGNAIDAPAGLVRKGVALTRPLLPFPGVVADPIVPGQSMDGLADAAALAADAGEGVSTAMRLANSRGATAAVVPPGTTPFNEAPLAGMPALPGVGSIALGPTPMAGAGAATDLAGALLPRAAGILDEEMARGALAAHAATAGSAPPGTAGRTTFAATPAARGQELANLLGHSVLPLATASVPAAMPGVPVATGILQASTAILPSATAIVPSSTGGDDLVRDLYGFVERFAGLLSGPGRSAARGDGASALTPRAPTPPGSTAIISFDLHNEESRTLTLRPLATALISEDGTQLPPECVRCDLVEITLSPGERKTLQMGVQVPAGAAPGCYTGLVVLTGTARLHSLIQVGVTAA